MDLFIKGQLAITNNADMCFTLSMQGTKVVSLDDSNDDKRLNEQFNPNVVSGLVLLPPMEAYWSAADGDESSFNNIYYNYLTTDQTAMDFLAIIIATLHNGTNVVIYYPTDEEVVLKFLWSYMGNEFGIWMGTETSDYMVNNEYLPKWLYLLYQARFIDAYEFMAYVPPQCVNQLDPYTLDLLALEIGLRGSVDDNRAYILSICANSMNPNARVPFSYI